MKATEPCPDLPDRCELQHEAFTSLGDVRFRRSSTDGLPMMALQLGEREAQFSLEALRREYAIGKDTADGRMLDLISSALDYVSSLQPGDRLPSEVRTGEASWKPSPDHVRLATSRLRLRVCQWQIPSGAWAKTSRDEANLLRLSDDPVLRDDFRTAAMQAAALLGLASGGDVIRLVEELAREFSYVEALRERLLARVVSLRRLLGSLLRNRNRAVVAYDPLPQVHRLMVIATKQISSRFQDVDAQTSDIADLLRDVETHRRFIRTNRDWLYRNQRVWEPMLDRWSHVPNIGDIGPLLTETYHFLALRFMPATSWQRPRRDRTRGPALSAMAW